MAVAAEFPEGRRCPLPPKHVFFIRFDVQYCSAKRRIPLVAKPPRTK